MKLVCILLIIASINFDFTLPAELKCSYKHYKWDAIGLTYYCSVQNYLNIISSESAVITGATGSHEDNKNNEDVCGLFAYNKKTKIFPRGLEKIYKNLKLISIRSGRFNEIHQSDLKPFLQLEYLDLDNNDIEVLEEGLFDFNPKLCLISIESNKISQIYSNIFDHLINLTYLWLSKNLCINKTVENNSAEVKQLIKHVQLQCPNPSIAYREVQKLKLNFNDLNLQLMEKLTKVEQTCQHFSTKITKLEELTSLSESNRSKIDKMEVRMAQKQFNETQDIKSKIEAIENFVVESYNFHYEKIEEVRKSVKEVQKNYQDINAKIQACVNSEKMEQNMQTLRQELKAQINDKFNELEASTKESTDQILRKIEALESRLQPSDIEAVNSKIQAMKPSESNSIKKLEDSVQNSASVHEKITKLNGYLKTSNKHIAALEKSKNITDADLQTLRTEMMTAFEKILEKLKENASKIEQKTTKKIEKMSTNLKDSYNHAFFRLHENMKHIESGLAFLNSKLPVSGTIKSSCESELDKN